VVTQIQQIRVDIPDSLTTCDPPPEDSYPYDAENQGVIAEWLVGMNAEYKNCVTRLERVTCLARGDCITDEG